MSQPLVFLPLVKRFAFIALAAVASGSLFGFHVISPNSAPEAHAPPTHFSGFKALRFDVVLDEGVPVVEWAAESEDDLDYYEVEASAESSADVRIVEVTPLGARHPYAFRDDDLYKGAEVVRYTLYAVLDDGTRQRVGSKQIAWTPTAVRRTWGSIKAMFQ